MSMSDPIADMLARIRNANLAQHKTVNIPYSNIKKTLADILLQEGYVKDVEVVEGDPFNEIKITLKYTPDKERVISGIKRISKPGLRIYAKRDELPRVLNGLGTAIVSTSKGILTDRDARRAGVGGEVICYVW